jgi:hypothetical protein
LHDSGEFIGGHTEILAVKELDAQAQGSGVSYARRYGLQSLLCIGAEDDDGESAIGRGKVTSGYAKTNIPYKDTLTIDKSINPSGTATVTITNTATPNKTDAAVAKLEEPKKGGFGVKKTVAKTEDGWE